MRTLAITLAALAAACASALTASASLADGNGRIVYTAAAGKRTQLFSIEPDGSGVGQLTRFAESDSLNASWSPDGERIAFERDFANRAGVYTMRADGTEVRSLTPKGFQGSPSYSPDGKRPTARC